MTIERQPAAWVTFPSPQGRGSLQVIHVGSWLVLGRGVCPEVLGAAERQCGCRSKQPRLGCAAYRNGAVSILMWRCAFAWILSLSSVACLEFSLSLSQNNRPARWRSLQPPNDRGIFHKEERLLLIMGLAHVRSSRSMNAKVRKFEPAIKIASDSGQSTSAASAAFCSGLKLAWARLPKPFSGGLNLFHDLLIIPRSFDGDR